MAQHHSDISMRKNRGRKYQFTIFEHNELTSHSAATKAIADCNKIFSENGYEDYTLVVHNNSVRDLKYYLKVFASICKFLARIERGSLVGIQYPMLNNVFKYFIKAARLKGIRFFCIIHDVESLRLGGKDEALVSREADNFNFYDCLIVHNPVMLDWLASKGVKTKMISLAVFDYLAGRRDQEAPAGFKRSVAFAGNLSKSVFIYDLGRIKGWNFNLYGPNFIKDRGNVENLIWKGVFSPDEVVYKLEGDFGLIWDGEHIDRFDGVLGNYLKYNNPHKFSLYLAAGMPVIAPRQSAIGRLISACNIGLLIDNLHDLEHIRIDEQQYQTLKDNCEKLRSQVINGSFFTAALSSVENYLNGPIAR